MGSISLAYIVPKLAKVWYIELRSYDIIAVRMVLRTFL